MSIASGSLLARALRSFRFRANSIRLWPNASRIRAQSRADAAPPLPSQELMFIVAGSEDPAWFLESGWRGAQSLRAILEKNGRRLEECGAVLDFGCGIGRVIRHFYDVKGPLFHGTDYNADLIRWCQDNLAFARFQVNALVGHLAYKPETFDYIYALSVFTHLTEAQQRFWMGELKRVLKRGGYLLITTHGAGHLAAIPPETVPADERRRFAAGEMVVCGGEHAGTNVCATFHPEAYVRGTLAKGFEVLDFIPEGALGNPRQDYYLLRRSA